VTAKISVAIMAHPKRERFIESITSVLDAEAPIVWDEKNDRWDTGRRSMLAYDKSATHHLVVQDDAIVCRDLVAGLTRAVEVVPDNPIGLYVGNVRPDQPQVYRRLHKALREDQSWLVMPGPWWGVGVCVPTHLIDAMVAWGDANTRIANYDRRMAAYFARVGLKCFYTVPSLVEHRQDHQSLVPGRVTVGRRAHWFIGATKSALDIDWSKVAGNGDARPKAHGAPEERLLAKQIRIVGPGGKRLRVSTKAYLEIYKPRGFRLVGEKRTPKQAEKKAAAT